MAGIAYVRKRLWNPELLIDVNKVLPYLMRESIDGSHPIAYEITWIGATQAGEELGTPATAVKDGRTVPFLVNMVSSDVADKRSTAAGAVHSVALVGVSTNSIAGYAAWNEFGETTREGQDGKPRATVEVVAMNGTTDVLATRYWIWLDAIYACEWGTGASDATGIITAESPVNTNLIVLSATQNEGEGGRWHFPPGKQVRVKHVHITPTEVFAATTGVVLAGTWTGNDQANNTDPDLNSDYFHYVTPSLSAQYDADKVSRYTTINSQCIWSETSVFASKTMYINILQIAE
ncbi:hypothetical protein LCGC14_0566990 [marine sediment metagenome]|uniref:Uncharacterized protein n=1 Tax=marine sediment metagenome TaxID=412755 RepID=A0A0F9S3Y9_9ZZZZ